jgi:hypothetical protein
LAACAATHASAPKVGWVILPVLALFLVLQLLRWVVPRQPRQPPGERGA